jgi:hypothetical protein
MVLADKLDDVGKAGWIVATVAGFWLFWPVGVAILVFLSWSGRMRAWKYERRGRWYNGADSAQSGTYGAWGIGSGSGGGAGSGGGWGGGCGWRGKSSGPQPSGNAAFDEYRTETLRRLEEEQREFVDYLEKLRRAKDKAEFDQFMADRRRPPTVPETPEQL